MQILSYHVAIVGGGIIGKTCALLLAQQGMRVAWVSTPNLVQADRVYALSASTQTLLSQLRVWQALDCARIQPVADMRIFGNANGQFALQFSAYAAALPQLAWIVFGGDIETALDTALRFQQNVTHIVSHAQALEQEDAQGICLRLENGQQLRAECLIGADGVHSWTRTQAGIDLQVHPYGQTGVVAQFVAERPHHGVAYQWFVDGEILALLPLPQNQFSLVWSAHDAHARALLAMDAAQLASCVQNKATVAQHVGRLHGVSAPRGFALNLRRATRLVASRIALVGDAAHCIHPLAGQGVNLGLRDVATLGRVFAAKEGFRCYGDARLLGRYARARAADIMLMVNATHGLQRCFLPTTSPAVYMRNMGMTLVNRLPPIKNFLIKRALG
ncbi:MAG: UbiH/UbiF family hydroxylase [Ottowia sp.]|nr:UbiH/UbiF family hydroxylase [Ottowia sp.]